MHRKVLDLIAAMGVAFSGILWVLLPIHPLLVGVLLAVALVFFLPGYTLTQVLFAWRAGDTPIQPFSTVDCLVFSLGLSLVIAIITGLLLNLLPAGLQWQAWTLALAIITGGFALLASFLRRGNPHRSGPWWSPTVPGFMRHLLRRPRATTSDHPPHLFHYLSAREGLYAKPISRQLPKKTILIRDVRPVSTIYTSRSSRHPTSGGDQDRSQRAGRKLSMKEYLLLGIASGIVILALWLSIMRPPQPQPSFTQFWMLPSTQARTSCAVLIGVRNVEGRPQTYGIQVTRNGIQVASWPSITLVPQQEWDHLLPVSSEAVSDTVFVNAQLYRLDQPGVVYREVHVTLHSC